MNNRIVPLEVDPKLNSSVAGLATVQTGYKRKIQLEVDPKLNSSLAELATSSVAGLATAQTDCQASRLPKNCRPDRSGVSAARTVVALAFIMMAIACFVYSGMSRGELPAPVLDHFRKLETIEFCSIHPLRSSERASTTQAEMHSQVFGDELEGHAILGVAEIANDGGLIEAIVKADRENNSKVAGCFNPRHAIRDPENPETFWLICFECFQMKCKFEGSVKTIKISESAAKLFESKVAELGLPVGSKH